ncbi:hypothetical protein [Pseudomonas fluorescens]|uniref:hypothetical protein n=1 Tax=Pseudomonas fluorescens TaxID=294 RepID=UPI003D68181A
MSGRDELSLLAQDFNTFTGKVRHLIGEMLGSAQSLGLAAAYLRDNAGVAQQQSAQQSQQMEHRCPENAASSLLALASGGPYQSAKV